MRSTWNEMPVLRAVAAVIAGIMLHITAKELGANTRLLCTMALGFTLFFILLAWVISKLKITLYYKLRWAHGLALQLALTTAGFALTYFHTEIYSAAHFSKKLQPNSVLVCLITEPPLLKEKTVTAIAQVQAVNHQGNMQFTEGKLLLNFLKDSASRQLHYGDIVVVAAPVEEFEEPKNPNEFSFKLYQSFHNVYHRAFATTGRWALIRPQQGNRFFEAVYALRHHFLQVIEQHVKNPNDFGVATAIMLGYRDYMNADIVKAYSSSGALHVLSVSGLHVGIIYYMLSFLFGWLEKWARRGTIVKSVIIILLIWGYACLTGLCPSVLRSAMMFSMIQSGKLFNRYVNIYNIIAGSALLLILWNPYIITEIGFRLSYLAVIGIIYLQPKIYGCFTFKNWLLDKAWMITAVSIAAQIATFPIGLYYFHQFPLLFMISNLVVIPISNLILFIGTGLLAVSEIPYMNTGVGWAFSALLWFLDLFVFWIDSLSFSLIEGIAVSMVEMYALYLFIALTCWAFETYHSKVLIAAGSLLLTLCIYWSYEIAIRPQQKIFTVYHVPKKSAIAFIDGARAYHRFDADLVNNYSAMLFHIKHHWWDCGVKQQLPVNAQTAAIATEKLPFGTLYSFTGKRILVVDSAIARFTVTPPHKLWVDKVILSNNPRLHLTDLSKLVSFKIIVFDTSNKKWQVKNWLKEAEKLHLTCWNVSAQGAYVAKL